MTKPLTDSQFPFTTDDAAACDAIIAEYRNNTLVALPAWLEKEEQLHPERYADVDMSGPAGLAAWDFFAERCKALGLEFTFGEEGD